MLEHVPEVIELTADALRSFLHSHGEEEYVLVDVRQPDEYLEVHLPGAWLVPLTELEGRVGELAPWPHRVVYCRNGARSRRAAAVVSRRSRDGAVYHLDGGLLAWQGRTAASRPRLKVFEGAIGLAATLRVGMDLEKGAHRLYQVLLALLADQPAAPIVRMLQEAEAGHARTLHGFYVRALDGPAEPFDVLFESLPGELLESGERLEDVVAHLDALADRGAAELLDVAAEMELAACDLYRTVAALAPDDEIRAVFLDLAQEERLHAVAALAAIEAQAAERVALDRRPS